MFRKLLDRFRKPEPDPEFWLMDDDLDEMLELAKHGSIAYVWHDENSKLAQSITVIDGRCGTSAAFATKMWDSPNFLIMGTNPPTPIEVTDWLIENGIPSNIHRDRDRPPYAFDRAEEAEMVKHFGIAVSHIFYYASLTGRVPCGARMTDEEAIHFLLSSSLPLTLSEPIIE